MSDRFLAAYFPKDSLVLRDGTKTEHPERLILGVYDDEKDTGHTKIVIEGKEFEHLFKALEDGYVITKKKKGK